MSNLGTMVAKIREDINRGSSYDDRIKRAIADAIHYFRAKRVGFNIKRAYATVTSGMEYVSLPTDWIEADFLQLNDGPRREPLSEVTYDWIEDRAEPTDERAEPYKYALQNRTLRLYPIPDRTYTLMFSYQFEWKNISRSSSDAETNPWLTEGEECIRTFAMADLYVNFMDGPENIQKGRMLRGDAEGEDGDGGMIGKLESQAAREQSSGRIKPFHM